MQQAMQPLMKLISRTTRCAILFRDSAFKDLDLTGTQHTYIMAICRQPGINPIQLAKQLFINKSNVTRQLNLLEQNGFITRRTEEGNRRQVAIYPTDKAHEVYPMVLTVLGNWNRIITAGLDEGEQEQLISLMARVMKNAEQAATGDLEDQL